jgi:hypothetical protein
MFDMANMQSGSMVGKKITIARSEAPAIITSSSHESIEWRSLKISAACSTSMSASGNFPIPILNAPSDFGRHSYGVRKAWGRNINAVDVHAEPVEMAKRSDSVR